MVHRFFDFEVFAHWWCCTFGDYKDSDNITEDVKDNFKVVTSDDVNCRESLLNLLREEGYVQTGYNVKGYDLVIANGIYQGFSPEQVKMINDIIINPSNAYISKEHIRMSPFSKRKLSGVIYQDLMDDGAGSLKDKEATLGLSILESSVPFDKEFLTEEDKKDVIYYNKQDVYASMVFYDKVVKPYTKTKLHLSKHFGIPEDVCYKSTNAKLVSMALGAKRKTHSDEDCVVIQIPSKVREYCYENLPNKVLERIRGTKDNFSVNMFDNTVSFGNGGIHSTYTGNFTSSPCLYIESDDDYVLFMMDASSYYPSIMIQLGLLSRNVEDPEKFKYIFDERIMLKHKIDKTEEDEAAQKADKLVLNTTFGAAGNKYLDLYDPYMCTAVCKVGQILLASLANKIHNNVMNCKIIQSNTDGLLLYAKRSDMDKIEKYKKEWCDITGINLEIDFVDKIWQRDVNNYLMLQSDGKVKRKGNWLNDDYYRPGYVTTASANGYVSAKAAIKFLLYKENVITNIVKNKNLQDFCITCTKGPTYSKVVQRMSDGTEVTLYKANRVIATTDTKYGMIYKIKKYKDRLSYAQMPSIPEHCLLVNDDLSHYNFDEVRKKIDYMYYIQRTLDLLDVEWYQMVGNDLFRNNEFYPDID